MTKHKLPVPASGAIEGEYEDQLQTLSADVHAECIRHAREFFHTDEGMMTVLGIKSRPMKKVDGKTS